MTSPDPQDARIAELEEALRPFAKESERYAIAETHGEPHHIDSFWVYVELGDCRRAALAMSKGKDAEVKS